MSVLVAATLFVARYLVRTVQFNKNHSLNTLCGSRSEDLVYPDCTAAAQIPFILFVPSGSSLIDNIEVGSDTRRVTDDVAIAFAESV